MLLLHDMNITEQAWKNKENVRDSPTFWGRNSPLFSTLTFIPLSSLAVTGIFSPALSLSSGFLGRLAFLTKNMMYEQHSILYDRMIQMHNVTDGSTAKTAGLDRETKI